MTSGIEPYAMACFGGHDADDGERRAVEHERLAENRRIAAEAATATPRSSRIAIGAVVATSVSASVNARPCESVGPITRRKLADTNAPNEAIGRVAAGEVDALAAIRAHLLERAIEPAPIDDSPRTTRPVRPACPARHSRRRAVGVRKGSGRISTALTTEKIAVFAPMPSASVSAATAVKPGRRRARERRSEDPGAGCPCCLSVGRVAVVWRVASASHTPWRRATRSTSRCASSRA